MARRRLHDYEDKRDFGRTPEPRPRRGARRGAAPVFVVHRHEASRLHYDLRLEMGGALKSWAVPKGFSYDPAEKRLAVRTEDHPLEYEHFHGVIPDGEYGAGSMTIWDRGHFEVLRAADPAAAVEQGELKVVLHGRKLRGEWHLVRTRQEQGRHWLLFKSRDRYAADDRDTALGVDLDRAREASLPKRVQRMQPGAQVAPFSDPDWVFEMDFAGRRVLAVWQDGRARLRGLSRELPALAGDLAGLRASSALLDGVLVALDEHERPCPQTLARRLAGEPGPEPCLYVFDLLHYDEFDLRPLSLLERKSALRAVLPEDASSLLYVDHVAGQGEELARVVAGAGLPGILAKRAASVYASGPSPDWRRIVVAPAAAPRGSVTRALARPAPRAGRRRFRISNPGKVFWPAEGFTKSDLLTYYERVADLLLPHLRERPVHMNRFPDGIEGKSFYQRHVNETIADWIETERLGGDDESEAERFVICNDRETLLYLANLGSIDLHPWLSRRTSPDSPDWAVLDLDPKQAPFTHVVAIARAAGRLLHEIGLRPLLKTSGASGLHVYVPLQPGYSYDQSRTFCEGVARVLCRELPAISTVERNPDRRQGKVYLDFLQNAKGQTVVPPYVPRPVPGATVSTPLAWDELVDGLHPSRFTIQTVWPRLEQGHDVFAGALSDPQDLLPAIEALASRLRASR